MNNEKRLSTPVPRWTLEEIKAMAEYFRKVDPVLIQAREDKKDKSDKQKPQ